MFGLSSQRAVSTAIAVVALAALVIGEPALFGSRPTDTLPVRGATDSASAGITVQGTGTITLSPDLATISVGVQAQAPQAAQAQDRASAAMAKVIDAVKAAGIADRDLTTQWISLQPTYDYGSNGSAPPVVTGYQASQSLSVKVHDVANAGAVIDAAVGAGANEVGGISFSVADPTGATAKARTAAMADARQHAVALAQAAGVSLGALLSVSEVSTPVSTPFPYGGDAVAPVVKTPVQAGTTDIMVIVQATFAIGG